MEQHFVAGFCDETIKIARIFGKKEPEHVFSEAPFPFSSRKKDYLRYAKTKAKEDPTSKTKAILGGAAVGAAPAGIGSGLALLANLVEKKKMQPWGQTAKITGAGALIGAIPGALLALALRSGDKQAIEHARQLVKDPSKVGPFLRQEMSRRHDYEREMDRDAWRGRPPSGEVKKK